SRLEGWLSIPNRANIKRYGWRKQYVVVSSKKILFYNDEQDKEQSNPSMVLDIDKLFHVRPVTQGDVYRAEADELPRIFQILYANEGECRKEADLETIPQVNYDVTSARDMLLLALTQDEQKKWIGHLGKKIPKTPPSSFSRASPRTMSTRSVANQSFRRNPRFSSGQSSRAQSNLHAADTSSSSC
ncbi:rho-associated protein kinase 1 isoform X1, partial [Tachysurus ichikawai]